MKNWQENALRYFCLGLNSKEIALLVGISYRTVQGVITKEKWKEQRRNQQVQAEKRIIKRYLKTLKKSKD